LLVRLEALTIDEIAVRDLPRLLDVAVKVERQAMALEGSRVAVDVVAIRRELPVDISRRILSTPEAGTSPPARSRTSPGLGTQRWNDSQQKPKH
jgi:hypothetical protein